MHISVISNLYNPVKFNKMKLQVFTQVSEIIHYGDVLCKNIGLFTQP